MLTSFFAPGVDTEKKFKSLFADGEQIKPDLMPEKLTEQPLPIKQQNTKKRAPFIKKSKTAAPGESPLKKPHHATGIFRSTNKETNEGVEALLSLLQSTPPH